jgi:hypothetical protein
VHFCAAAPRGQIGPRKTRERSRPTRQDTQLRTRKQVSSGPVTRVSECARSRVPRRPASTGTPKDGASRSARPLTPRMRAPDSRSGARPLRTTGRRPGRQSRDARFGQAMRALLVRDLRRLDLVLSGCLGPGHRCARLPRGSGRGQVDGDGLNDVVIGPDEALHRRSPRDGAAWIVFGEWDAADVHLGRWERATSSSTGRYETTRVRRSRAVAGRAVVTFHSRVAAERLRAAS